MTRAEALDVAKEVLIEHQSPKNGTVDVSAYLVALLIRLDLLQVDDD